MADESTLPTEEEIRQLPRWARVAFAARCARLAWHALDRSGLIVDPKHRAAIQRAVELSENIATTATAEASETASAALTANGYGNDAHIAGGPLLLVGAAFSAASAASTANTANSLSEAVGNVLATVATAAKAGVSPALIRDSFRKLLTENRTQNWTNDTPVPPTVFDPIEEQPADIPQSFRLNLRAIAEKGVSADTVRKHLVALYKALNEHFLEKYDTFLTRDQFKRLVYEEVRVRV